MGIEYLLRDTTKLVSLGRQGVAFRSHKGRRYTAGPVYVVLLMSALKSEPLWESLDDTEPTIAYTGLVAVDIKHEEAPGNPVADPAKKRWREK